jgi:hypothetical protein
LKATGSPGVYQCGRRFVAKWDDEHGRQRQRTKDELADAIELRARQVAAIRAAKAARREAAKRAAKAAATMGEARRTEIAGRLDSILATRAGAFRNATGCEQRDDSQRADPAAVTGSHTSAQQTRREQRRAVLPDRAA